MLIDLGNGLHYILLKDNVLPELGKWTNIASALLCLLATLISAIVLATKKYSSLLMGFVVTALCALATAVFATWTASWFIRALSLDGNQTQSPTLASTGASRPLQRY